MSVVDSVLVSPSSLSLYVDEETDPAEYEPEGEPEFAGDMTGRVRVSRALAGRLRVQPQLTGRVLIYPA